MPILVNKTSGEILKDLKYKDKYSGKVKTIENVYVKDNQAYNKDNDFAITEIEKFNNRFK